MFAYRQPTFSYGSPYTTSYVPQEMPPLYLDPPQRVNGLGRVSLEQMRMEKHAKLFRDHQDAMQTHNGIREAHEDLIGQRINNPKM